MPCLGRGRARFPRAAPHPRRLCPPPQAPLSLPHLPPSPQPGAVPPAPPPALSLGPLWQGLLAASAAASHLRAGSGSSEKGGGGKKGP